MTPRFWEGMAWSLATGAVAALALLDVFLAVLLATGGSL